jgi:hypothetical protein
MTAFQFQLILMIVKFAFYAASGQSIEDKKSKGMLIKMLSGGFFILNDIYVMTIAFNPLTVGNLATTIFATVQYVRIYLKWVEDERGLNV